MPRPQRIRRLIERFGGPIAVRRHLETLNRDGRAIHRFGDPEDIWGSVRPISVEEFEIGPEGQVDAARYTLSTLERPPDMSEADAAAAEHIVHPPLENDDRVGYRGNVWRAVQKRYGDRNSVARFALVEDSRTAESDTGTPGDEDPDRGGDWVPDTG